MEDEPSPFAGIGKVARSFALRLTPGGRRRLALEHGALHSHDREPGLHDVDEEGVVRSGGVDVRYYRVGPVDAAVTVVFVHGFTLAAESFYLQVDHLRRHHPQVGCLLLDLRGHGQTGAVPPGDCTVAGLADDVQAVIRHRAPTGRIVLLGHSLGGLAVLNAMRRMVNEDPQLHARVDALILAATSIESLAAQGIPQVLASPVADQTMAAVEASPTQTRKVREAAAKLLAPTLAAAFFHRPTGYERVEFHAAMIHETPLASFVGFFEDLQHHDEQGAGESLRGKMGFILVGEVDAVTPVGQSEQLCRAWPEAWFQVAPGAGHMLILEAPEFINNALDHVLSRL